MHIATQHTGDVDAWDTSMCEALIAELRMLREAMVDFPKRIGPWIRDVDPVHRASASNLAHYLAMRRVDLRRLQERLARIGLSSLGRSETHVLANLDKVLGILHVLAGRGWTPKKPEEPAGYVSGMALLERNVEALFGSALPERAVRIMVTLPVEAASEGTLVESLVASGMDIARINCAHDSAAQWIAMAEHVRDASRKLGRAVRILMDLGGPKLRTGLVESGPTVLKLKPTRDEFGLVTSLAHVGLREAGSTSVVEGATPHVGVDAAWLAQLEPGDRIDLTDARAAVRSLTVLRRQPGGVLVECARTAYLTSDTRLRLNRRDAKLRDSLVRELPTTAGVVRLHRGDTLRLVRDGLGHGAAEDRGRRGARVATIACTLPKALDAMRKGQRVWFDDGRIGAVVRRRISKGVELEITTARDGGEKLAADKGINLPDTQLDLPALTAKDIQDLPVVAKHADLVGLSFAQSAEDVRQLLDRLREHAAPHLGIILKIETRRGFEHLPEMLFAAMGTRAAGVMIARGDLAVECGYERMAEVQEEILWACEAAHLPVVWATQVLETLAKTGLPSRAEITDAAMGERAECVMLNKGPHILDAIRALDDILRRMQSHQTKKRPQLRALRAWRPPPDASQKPPHLPHRQRATA
jgi:pyruvate kinase